EPPSVRRVGLAQGDDLRFVGKTCAIGGELVAHHLPGGERVLFAGIYQVEEDAAALDMAEEAVADAGALGGALDQAGDVGEDELAAAMRDHPQLRAQRREGIVADLGTGIGYSVEKSRFSGIGQADETGVGEELQAQPDPGLLARPAGAVLARRAIRRTFVAGIATAAVAALEQRHALADVGEVGKDMLLVIGEDLGADRNLDHQIGAARAGAVGAGAALAARSAEMLSVAEV